MASGTDILSRIFEAGVVGCGGAGFPAHMKLKGSTDYYIVNGAECEPLLRTDRYLLRHYAEDIVSAAAQMGREMGAEHVVIAMKGSYRDEIAAVKKAVEDTESPVEIFELGNFYPAGDEQIMIYEVTGRIVPAGGLPGDVGVVVSNTATVKAIHDAVEGGNFISKYLTVTGRVRKPVILKVPVGTSVRDCIDFACPETEAFNYITGGPMMGKLKPGEDAKDDVVTRTTSGIIVVGKDDWISSRRRMSPEQMLNRARSACIQCSFCTEMCSRHMLGHPIRPHRIMRKMSMERDIGKLLEDRDIINALACSECGICEEYACPMGLQPRTINSMIRQRLRSEGIRMDLPQTEYEADPMREYRKVPSKRMASRLKLSEFYSIEIDELAELEPDRVSIPLKQHAGVPARAVVQTGEIVQAGQLIGACPEGSLGANVHASVSGTVVETGDNIVIERMK